MDLALAAAKIVADVVETFVGRQFITDLLRGSLQGVEIAPAQLDIKRVTALSSGVSTEGELLDSGDGANELAPAVG